MAESYKAPFLIERAGRDLAAGMRGHRGYFVFVLDPDRYALVTSGTRDYLWLLARAKKLPAEPTQDLLAKAAAAGFDTNSLIWVKQE